MKRFRLVGAVLVVAAVSGVFAASASAVSFLLAEWLVNGSSVTSELLTQTTGELLLEDSKTLVGKASVLCSSSLDGWVGSNSLGRISEMLTLAGVAVSTTVLSGTALECTAQSGCEMGTKPKVWAANLGWETEAELMEQGAEAFFANLILPHTGGSNPGWEMECTVIGIKFVDECTAAESVAELKLEGATLLEKFSKAFSELAAVKLANCSQGGTESGVVEGGDSFILVGGGELSVSSEGGEVGGEPTATSQSTVLSGEGKEGVTLTVLEGSKVKDKATLKGTNASTATGKVVYKVYSDGTCKTLVTTAGEATVSGESVPASSEVELEGGASYYWQAHYSGDSKNAESTSECTEISSIKAKTSLSTKLVGEGKEGEELTILEGSKVKDKATLTGTKSSSAGGKVVYKIYSDKECKALVKEAGEVTVSSGSVPASSEQELEGGETYYWQATYKGDSLHQESTSSCGSEILNVQAKTTLPTTISGEGKEAEELEIVEGEGAVAQASVNGKEAAMASGKVVYNVYSDMECKTLAVEAGEVTVTNGSTPVSTEEKLTAGTYYWQAAYSGDSKNEASTSACEREVVTTKTATSLTTLLAGEGQSGESVTVGEEVPVFDTTTLSGANASKAAGTVNYDVYSDSECKTLVAETGEVTVTNGTVPASTEVKLKAGTYYWQATYSGDSSNSGSTSTCGSEFAVVTPPLTTTLAGEGQSGQEVGVLEGSGVSDDATLRGEHAATAGGTVTYKVYSDKECKSLVAEAGEVTVTNGNIPASTEEKLTAGTYYWQDSYSGDSKDPAATSACGVEVDYVETSTSLTASLSGENNSGEKIEVKEGETVGATATLSGTNVSTAAGYLSYYVYSDSECKHLVTEAGDESVSKGNVPESTKETLPAGTYYWQETYTGDGINHSATSTCGVGIVVVTTPVTTSLSDGTQSGPEVEVPETTAVTDIATLHGEHVSTAGGTVKYDVYSDPECKTLATEAGEVTVTNGSVPPSNEEKLLAGDYYWQASYSGDSKNPPATSTCGKALAIVESTAHQYAALGDSYSSGEGAGAYYSKTNTWDKTNKCHRSRKAYSVRVAEGVLFTASVGGEGEVLKQQPPSFIFRACSGAVAENLWGGGPFGGQYNEWIAGPNRWLTTPAQDLWLELPGGVPSVGRNPNIDLVTLTVGGDDAGFRDVVDKCISGPYVDRYAECTATIKGWEAGISSLTTKLPVVLSDIRTAAPNARIRVLLYPKPINMASRSIYVNRGFYIENSPVASRSVAVALEAYMALLNQTISTTVTSWAASSRAPAAVIGGTVQAFVGHQLGDAQPWLNGVQIYWREESFHPNCQGHVAVAEQLVLDLRRAVPGGWSC